MTVRSAPDGVLDAPDVRPGGPGRIDARRLVKHVLATTLTRVGAAPVLSALFRRAAPLVIGYHRVVEDFDASARHAIPAMLVSQAMLEQHLDRIGRSYRFVSLEELAGALEDGRPLPRGIAALTFDDGYRDVYENAIPLLVRKGIPAAVFVVSDLVGTTRLQIHDRLFVLLGRADGRLLQSLLATRMDQADVSTGGRELVRTATGSTLAMTRALLQTLRFDQLQAFLKDLESEVGSACCGTPDLQTMTWDMLADMRAKGFTIGSHTCRHTLLANEPPAVVAHEVQASRARLEAGLHAPVTHFAYPDGSFNAATVQAVATSGYRFAYTACDHVNPEQPLLTIPRRILWERSSLDAAGRFAPAILDCQVQGLFAKSRDCRAKSHH